MFIWTFIVKKKLYRHLQHTYIFIGASPKITTVAKMTIKIFPFLVSANIFETSNNNSVRLKLSVSIPNISSSYAQNTVFLISRKNLNKGFQYKQKTWNLTPFHLFIFLWYIFFVRIISTSLRELYISWLNHIL